MIDSFIIDGGNAFGTCTAGLNNDLFGVAFTGIGNITDAELIMVDKTYKNGVDRRL